MTSTEHFANELLESIISQQMQLLIIIFAVKIRHLSHPRLTDDWPIYGIHRHYKFPPLELVIFRLLLLLIINIDHSYPPKNQKRHN